MPSATIRDLEGLLDAEREALLAGDFGRLAELVARKEALVQKLGDADAGNDALRALRARAERNAELLTAAGRGIRSVLRRLAEIRSANGPLKTYGKDGTAQTLGAGGGSFEKRA